MRLIDADKILDAIGREDDCLDCKHLKSDEEMSICDMCRLLDTAPTAVCDDCIWKTCNYNRVDWDSKSDLIRREDAIDVVRRGQEWFAPRETDADCIGFEVCEDIVKGLENLPSADRTGHWIKETYIGWRYECPLCGHLIVSDEELGFCPSCGADMRGEEYE